MFTPLVYSQSCGIAAYAVPVPYFISIAKGLKCESAFPF